MAGLAVVFAATASGAGSSPIEGTWAYGQNAIVIKATGSATYSGTLTKPLTVHWRFEDCTTPAGYAVMAITGSAAPFHVTTTYVGGTGCTEATVYSLGTLAPRTAYGKSVLYWCSASPGKPIPTSGDSCQNLERVGAAPATTTASTSSKITSIVPAGQTKNASKPTLTGAGQHSYFAPTFDRAVKNNYPNKARLLGEVYLGDGGATATYTIKTLSTTPKRFSLWIYYNDDGLHASGARAVVVSIPKLKWSIPWSNKSQDTKGWKAVKIGTITTSGNFTVSFRKQATTSAAFVMNAFALTTGTQAPAFG